MTRTVLLVDYQNTRDSGLQDLPDHQRILLFVGKGQKPKAEFVQNVMKRDVRLDLIPVREDGNDNLDFHLAFYFGRLLAEEPDADFIIISNDQDFDPLVRHVDSLGIPCKRRGTLRAKASVPAARAPKPAPAKSAPKPARAKAAPKAAVPKPAAARAPRPADDGPLAPATSFLKNAGSRRPKTKTKLAHALENFLHKSAAEIDGVIEGLTQKGVVTISPAGGITYRF